MAKKSNYQNNTHRPNNPEADLVALSEQPMEKPTLPQAETGLMPEDDPSFESVGAFDQPEVTPIEPSVGFNLQDKNGTGQATREAGRQTMQSQPESTPQQSYGQAAMSKAQSANLMSHSGYGQSSYAASPLFNLGNLKQWFAFLGGVYLAIYGLSRSLGSLTVAGAGMGLVYYAVTGRWPLAGQISGLKTNQTAANSVSGVGALNAILNAGESTNTKNILVKAPIEQVYQTWANFENFPNFMHHIKQVDKTGDRTSHWVMEGPLNTKIEWDAETTRLDENKRIAWNSITGDIKTSGQVTFNELPDKQVEVTVMLKYVPPAGLAGEIIAELFSNPEGKLLEDLRNFKRYIETQAQPA
ncbi:MAG: SRPBCC family protein [Chloroflexi bacterium]|nr:SRPBCC family protein [Chloroflexota bacterium]